MNSPVIQHPTQTNNRSRSVEEEQKAKECYNTHLGRMPESPGVIVATLL